MKQRIFGGVFVASLVLFAMPGPASAECVPIPGDIWSAPAELIVWMFWFNFPDVMQECAYIMGTYDPWPLIQCVVSYSCAWG